MLVLPVGIYGQKFVVKMCGPRRGSCKNFAGFCGRLRMQVAWGPQAKMPRLRESQASLGKDAGYVLL